jgi:hypothetical protein
MPARPRSKSTRSTSRAKPIAPPKAWTRVYGTVYGIKWETVGQPWSLRRRRTRIEYVGMYSGDWHERIRQHLYGGGPHHCKPKPWAVLVPGYDENARTDAQQKAAVKQVITQGGAVVLWQKRRLRWSSAKGFYWKRVRTFYWVVKFRESLAIGSIRPAANDRENRDNPRRIPLWDQEAIVADLLARRDRAARNRENATEMGVHISPEDGLVKWFGSEVSEVAPVDEGFQVRCRDGREWEVF